MSLAVFDFNKSERLPSDVAQRFSGWLRTACTIASKNLGLPFAVELTFQDTDAGSPRELLDHLSETAVAYRLAVAPEKVPSLFVLPRPLVLALVAGVVGSNVTSLPDDREVTLVEETLYEYLLSQTILSPFRETWPAAEPLPLQLLQKEPNPRWSRLFPPSEALVAFSFQIKGPFGDQIAHWLLPKRWVFSQRDTPPTSEKPVVAPAVATRPFLESSLRPLQTEVSVALGAAELRLSQLAKLRPGDVIILDQKISLPVVGQVAGKEKFRAWPGKKGSRQHVQIESFLDA